MTVCVKSLLKYFNSTYTVCVYIYQDRMLVKRHYVRDSYISQRQHKKQAEKMYSSQKTNKDHFRCLITIWSIGIARRGPYELIFVKT